LENKHIEKNRKEGRPWCCISVVPATQEAEEGGLWSKASLGRAQDPI
jgi:hypothetical protein